MVSSMVAPGEGKTIALQGGHTVTFLHRATNSGYSLIEWMAPPAIPGPPLHIHRVTDEGFYVLEGTVYEGDWTPRRIVLLEFPSVAAWESFYNGPVYQGLKTIRDECSSARLVSVDGLVT